MVLFQINFLADCNGTAGDVKLLYSNTQVLLRLVLVLTPKYLLTVYGTVDKKGDLPVMIYLAADFLHCWVALRKRPHAKFFRYSGQWSFEEKSF